MAWEWSHSHQAYANAEGRLMLKAEAADKGDEDNQEWLEEIYSEWEATEFDEDGSPGYFCLDKYAVAQRECRAIAKQTSWQDIAEQIWMRASNYAVCTNGGHDAYVCPEGCGAHLVSFNSLTSEELGE